MAARSFTTCKSNPSDFDVLRFDKRAFSYIPCTPHPRWRVKRTIWLSRSPSLLLQKLVDRLSQGFDKRNSSPTIFFQIVQSPSPNHSSSKPSVCLQMVQSERELQLRKQLESGRNALRKGRFFFEVSALIADRYFDTIAKST